MTTTQFELKKANRFLPHILLIGLGIGSANFIMHGGLNWIQWAIQALSTSFLIGYSTVLLGINKSWLKINISPIWKLYIVLISIFLLVGFFATEIEHVIRALIFKSESYLPFSAGKMYVFNGVISGVLGLSVFENNYLVQGSKSKSTENNLELGGDLYPQEKLSKSTDIASSIPVKQGDCILLIPTIEIVYFEAYDNYSFVFDVNGQKKLCDYSLLFLEKRLENLFSRIHRKYLVNEDYIKQIKPHINGRYIIEFSVKGISSITSSKTYSDKIRRLIKIE
ncbi:LytR/AlgR family response regulator transcription factor [Maribacter sp. 4G9]|uniref:LytR/AlgR family response regulator transcription factor n=1 Tax=Maribacter sp. 4G9 TaxID=1889777 RepID=UPI000F4E5D6C|nr:LytTR family DNA-binding domain-containing protein [Maribacter sp. 4G9]